MSENEDKTKVDEEVTNPVVPEVANNVIPETPAEVTTKPEFDEEVWGKPEGEVQRSVLQTLHDAGVAPTEAKALLWDAVEQGDITKIDRDTLVEKVGKAQATLIMTGVKQVIADIEGRKTEVTGYTVAAAGTADNWKKAAAWAVKTIPAAELDEIRADLDAGGRRAKYATKELVDRYNADPGNTTLGKTPVDATQGGGKGEVGITRREAGARMIRLRPGDTSGADEIRRLRSLGVKQGL